MTNPLYRENRFTRLFKQHAVAVAMCVGLGLGVTQTGFAKNANPPSLRANAPHVYVVKKGDTLWDISGHFLKSPWRWKEIWASNRHVKNPHWIYPGDRLLLCSLNGRPLIGKDEGDGCEGIIRRAGGKKASPQVRVENLNNMIPVIPLESIRHWLGEAIVVAPESVPNLPYVVGMTAEHVVSSDGDTIYARGNGLEESTRYDIYRQGEPYTEIDPATAGTKKEKARVIGVEFTKVASAVVKQTNQADNVTTLEITDSFGQEVRKGDLILPVYEQNLPTLFYPVPANEVRAGGEVIRIMGAIGGAGRGNVVALDRGATDGVKIGHVFALDIQGGTTTDPKTQEQVRLPNQRAGHAMVFKTFDRISYAYVLDSSTMIRPYAKLAVPLSEEQ